MKKYIVELKETRTFVVPVEIEDDQDEDDAYEIAEDTYLEKSTSDTFDGLERHGCTPEAAYEAATRRAGRPASK